MLHDRFDQILTAVLVVILIATAFLLVTAGPDQGLRAATGIDRQMEREIAYQARLSFLKRRYGPVEALRDSGALQEALLKLEEVGRDLPGEAHTDLMSGDILLRMGQFERALTKLSSAVRRNGDYVDSASPMNQRSLIVSAVSEVIPLVRDRLRTQPDNRSLAMVLKDGYYLQSRLAGGCE